MPARWNQFTEEERRTIAGALTDSGGIRSDYGWYMRCSKLHVELKTWTVKPVPDNPPSSGVSDTPGCNCNVEIWNLTRRRIEASLEVRFLRCSLHEAAPDLYTALQSMLENFGSLATFTSGFEACHAAHTALAKARGERPNAE